MAQFQNSGLAEGTVVTRWMANRFNANKNILAVTVGETGSGKSYSQLRIAELWYDYFFKTKFPSVNICFSIKEAMKLITSGNLPKGSLIIVEEAGVIMNSLDFQNKLVKFFGFVLQSFRSKNIGVIFNLPNISFLTKTARMLLHGTFVTTEIDKKAKQVVLKCLRTQVNPMTGKVYNKFLRVKLDHHSVPIKRVRYSMPSKELLDIYEKMKDEFVNKIGQQLMDAIDDNENENKGTSYEALKQRLIENFDKYSHWSTLEWAEFLSISRQKFYKQGMNLVLGELKTKKRLENTVPVVISPVLPNI